VALLNHEVDHPPAVDPLHFFISGDDDVEFTINSGLNG
jgi:hypothetical protein